jgi:FAD/FMN-containing dehydrogenase
MSRVANWGNHPVVEAEMRSFTTVEEAAQFVRQHDQLIPRGLGRCYGDSALQTHILSTQQFNRFIAFDERNGILTCQAGVSLAEVLETFVPRGWFLPVTPGTKFVTVGGAVASDVHGKNHHTEGCFGQHVRSLLLMDGEGNLRRCSPTENAELFKATLGGMGLTGLVLEVTFALKPIESAWIRQRAIKARNLDALFHLMQENLHYTYSVAWIDTVAGGSRMGRSILFLGEHAKRSELDTDARKSAPFTLPKAGKLAVPIDFPNFVLNKFTISIFNSLIYHKQMRKVKEMLIDYDKYFYPLDGIHQWNRIYGKRGFTQYQLVLPTANALEGMRKVLDHSRRNGLGSFLSVLKYMGPQTGMLSFPLEGYTLTLDFPASPRLWPILDQLDGIVADAGGRLYLTKDCRMGEKMFSQGYAEAGRFREIRKAAGAAKFSSLQSARVGV